LLDEVDAEEREVEVLLATVVLFVELPLVPVLVPVPVVLRVVVEGCSAEARAVLLRSWGEPNWSSKLPPFCSARRDATS
jgi:hypothetical protein